MKLSWGDYIYLHFMDRELRGSLGLVNKISDETVKRWVKAALLMSDMPLYVSLSHMYESIQEFPETVYFLFELEKLGFVRMVTNHTNTDEFIESRQNLYSFDRDRYQNYFEDHILLWPSNAYNDRKGTTRYLRERLLIEENHISFSARVDEIIRKSLDDNKRDAITIQRFAMLVHNEDKNNFQKNLLSTRITISRLYTKRYLEAFNGTIITGIEGFGEYDDLAKHQICTDMRIYSILAADVLREYENDERYLEFLISDQCDLLRNICHLIAEMAMKIHVKGDTVDAILIAIRKRLSICDYVDGHNNLFLLHNELKNVCKERGIDISVKEIVFLVVVATQTELGILVKRIRQDYRIDTDISEMSYFSTSINDNIIYIVKCQMGAGGPGGATLTVGDAIKKFNPDFVIMCGIAWGGHPEKYKIGDVLVATKVWDYDPSKKNKSGEIFRGNITPTSSKMVQALEAVAVLVDEIPVHFGLLVSGSLLLNNKEEVERLKTAQPELIGGEMEAAGIASVCEREKKDWIIIKGICDWGFEKDSGDKDDNQRIAMDNAIYILIEMLRRYSSA